ncbi:MAG: MCE family protein [Deltaproteobacteria bacterium]|nr:MCE family protein [Deltaproteobacteria bacterium]
MKNLSTEIRVGLLVLAGIGSIVMGSVAVTGWRPGSGDTYKVTIQMDNASGLLVGSPAQVAGIKIGEVSAIDLEDGKAKVELAINNRYKLYADTMASLKSIGILGDKYIDVNPGTSSQAPLSDGGMISRTESGSDLDSMVGNANDILKELKGILGHLATFTESLAKDGPHITQDLRSILSDNKDSLDSSFKRLDSTLGNLDSITGKIDKGEGSLGKLVNDETTVEELNNALMGINSYLSDVTRLKLDIGLRAERLNQQQTYKSYLSFKLQPLKERFYMVELVDNPRGKVSSRTISTTTGGGAALETKETVTSQQMQWSLLIGQRYFDTLVQGGLIENHFGMGVNQYFGRADKYSIGLDVWDLGGEFGPHAKLSGLWRFYSGAFLVMGADDFASTNPKLRDAFFGVGINFNEDSLRPLFGSLPLSTISGP